MPLKHSSLQDVAQYLLKATQDRDGLRNDCGLEIGGSTNLMLIDGSEIRLSTLDVENLVNTGINYQPQLVSRISSITNITDITTMLARQEGCCGAVHRGADSLRNMQAWYIQTVDHKDN